MSRESFGRKNDEQVRELVATLIAREISDPRVSIYVSAEPSRYDEVLTGLESAKGHIRSLLGKSLGWRVTPELRFFIDESIDEGERIGDALLNVPPSLINEPSE